LLNPIFSNKVPYRSTAFVVEFDSTGNNLRFATFLGGALSGPSYVFARTVARVIAIDNSGDVYVGGSTDEQDFPTRGGFNGCHPSIGIYGDTSECSFVAKISSTGKLVYSTLVTSGGGCSSSGSGCIGNNSAYGTVDSIAVDATGAVTIGGALGGPYNATIKASFPGDGYVCRIAQDGSKPLWTATYAKANKILLALDPTGDVDLFGQYVPLLSSYPTLVLGPPVLFMAQLKPDGSGFNYSKDLGQWADVSASGMLVDKQGNVFLAGTSSSPQFPQTGSGLPNLGSDFVIKIDQSGLPIQPTLRLPHGAITAAPVFSSDGSLMLLGAGGSLLTVPSDYYGLGPPAIVAFANSASYALNTGVFPGALLTLYGFNFPTGAPGLQVQVSGRPAPILYAGPNQINLQVPFLLPSRPQTFGVTLSPGDVSIQVSSSESLGIFTNDGLQAAALNQDGTLNSQSNPANAGSVVSLFGTGAVWPDDTKEGIAPTAPMQLYPDLNQFQVHNIYQTPLAVLYAGTAPGLINGVFQLNVLLPPGPIPKPQSYSMYAQRKGLFGVMSSNTVQVYIK
jgi:uncharacterized protein (TIGR03437 family)